MSVFTVYTALRSRRCRLRTHGYGPEESHPILIASPFLLKPYPSSRDSLCCPSRPFSQTVDPRLYTLTRIHMLLLLHILWPCILWVSRGSGHNPWESCNTSRMDTSTARGLVNIEKVPQRSGCINAPLCQRMRVAFPSWEGTKSDCAHYRNSDSLSLLAIKCLGTKFLEHPAQSHNDGSHAWTAAVAHAQRHQVL